ncbi:MAG: hypothetical protein ACLS85_09145 [Coprobacillus cateniformis]
MINKYFKKVKQFLCFVWNVFIAIFFKTTKTFFDYHTKDFVFIEFSIYKSRDGPIFIL